MLVNVDGKYKRMFTAIQEETITARKDHNDRQRNKSYRNLHRHRDVHQVGITSRREKKPRNRKKSRMLVTVINNE